MNFFPFTSKNLIILLLTLSLFATTSLSNLTTLTALADNNLVLNPSAENGDSDPTNWNKTSWGTSTPTFTVENTGYNSAKSLKLEVTNYISGDSRWSFDNVNVEAGAKYDFEVFYKSTAVSNLIMDTTLANGSHTYSWHGTVNPATNWTSYKSIIIPPVNATKVNLFLAMNSNGIIQTDSYNLLKQTVITPPSNNNLIANNSFKSGEQGWTRVQWGVNTPNFELVSTGFDDTTAGKISMASYTSGDARWAFTNTPVTANTSYDFEIMTQSNVPSAFNVATTKSNGTVQYTWHGVVSANPTWTKSKFTFVTTPDAVSVNIFTPISQNGFLLVDNLVLQKSATQPPVNPVPTKFNRPLISIDFDDAWKSSYTDGFRLLDQFGYKGTAAVTTNHIVDQQTFVGIYMTNSQVLDLSNRNHAIASHAVDHFDLASLSTTEIEDQLRDSKNYLQNLIGKPVNYLITPFCSSNQVVDNIAKQYYPAGIRNCDSNYNTKANFDKYNIKSFPILSTTTQQEINSALDEAKANNYWLVFMYHEVNNSNNLYSVSASTLQSHLQSIKDRSLTVLTSEQAITEISAQL